MVFYFQTKILHSKTFAAKMETLARQTKYLPVSHRLKLRWKYYFGAREFRRELKVQNEKGVSPSGLDTIRNHWHYESTLIDEERRQLITDKYFRKANRLFVPTPPFTPEDDNKIWKHSNGFLYLTDEGLATVREEIEKEQKRRREARAHWIQWLLALTGLIGTIIGLFAVLNK